MKASKKEIIKEEDEVIYKEDDRYNEENIGINPLSKEE